MAIDGLTPTTELQAVNAMLATTGDTPVTSITPGLRADVDFALSLIRLAATSVQQKGWLFNTDRDVTLTPTVPPMASAGPITLDDNVLKVTKSLDVEAQRDIYISFRGGQLWDRTNNTDQFDENAEIIVDITRALDFEDMPEAARAYIFLLAARRYQQETLGNQELSGFGKEDEDRALTALVEAEGLLEDTDFLNNFPDQLRANKVLRDVSREVQGEGWKFNTLLNVPFAPSTDPDFLDMVLLDSTVIKAAKAQVSQMTGFDLAQRGAHMYDVINNVDTFDATLLPDGVLYLDVVTYLELDELPPTALRYIRIKAGRQLQSQRTTIQSQANGFTEADELLARRNLIQAEGRKEYFNMNRNMSVARSTRFRKDNFGRGRLRRSPGSQF